MQIAAGPVAIPGSVPRVDRDALRAVVIADVGDGIEALDVDRWLAVLTASANGRERLLPAVAARLVADGAGAARDRLALPLVVDAWLTAGWVLWRELHRQSSADQHAATAEYLIRALDDGAKALAEGYAREQRAALRRDEAGRAVLLDDLLGEAPVDEVLAAADRLGVDVGRERRVLVVAATSEDVLDRVRDAGALAAPRDGRIVAVLDRPPPRLPERSGLGRPGTGVDGVRRSYREAKRALAVAERLDLVGVVPYAEVLPEAILLEDPAGIAALVELVLGPLAGGGRGAAPLLSMLEAFFDEGANLAAAARRLRIAERTAAYRVERIEQLTGLDLGDATDRFRLELAIRGRRLLAADQRPT